MPDQDSTQPRRRVTRLAPSPTGSLHLGNARTFLINWALARKNNWQVVLRIDDLDGPRVKQGADQQAIDILRWLGLDWDAGPVYETQNIDHYNSALQQLSCDIQGRAVQPTKKPSISGKVNRSELLGEFELLVRHWSFETTLLAHSRSISMRSLVISW